MSLDIISMAPTLGKTPGRYAMLENENWLERLIRAANRVAPNGIAALALIFGILMILLVFVVLGR